jgi:hypothetical protein
MTVGPKASISFDEYSKVVTVFCDPEVPCSSKLVDDNLRYYTTTW